MSSGNRWGGVVKLFEITECKEREGGGGGSINICKQYFSQMCFYLAQQSQLQLVTPIMTRRKTRKKKTRPDSM